MESLI
jgi:hypothetical protein